MFIYRQDYYSIGLHKKMQQIAKDLRHHPTSAEQKLWIYLKNRQLGYKFRRQFSLYGYIVDFYCRELKLVVEVDGSIHKLHQEHDAGREDFLRLRGYRIIRFTNDQILNDIAGVLTKLPSLLNKEGRVGEER